MNIRYAAGAIFLIIPALLLVFLLTYQPPVTKVDGQTPNPVHTIGTSETAEHPPSVVDRFDSDPSPMELGIRGYVIDVSGDPVAGAEVSAYTANLGASRTISDSDGSFEIATPRGGQYRVSATKDGFNDDVLESIGAGSSEIVLRLTARSMIAGNVIDASTGSPVSEFEIARIDVAVPDEHAWQELARSEAASWQAVSNAQGRFTLEDVPSGKRFTIGARAPGYVPGHKVVESLEPGEQYSNVTMALEAGGTIHGTVLTARGAPVVGAEVFLGKDARGDAVSRTGTNGLYQIVGLPPGEFVLMALHPDFEPARTTITLIGAERIEANIVLGLGGAIMGTVRIGEEPVAGATIIVSTAVLARPAIEGPVKTAITSADGRFRIDGISVGNAYVSARVNRQHGDEQDVESQEATVEVLSDAVVTVDFEFPAEYARLEGSISANGSAALLGTVTVVAGGSSSSATIDTGVYRFERLPPGTATVTAEILSNEDDTTSRKLHQEILLTEGQTARLDFAFDAQTVLSGAVIGFGAGDSGEVSAIAGTTPPNLVSLEDIDALERVESARAPIDSDGIFRFDGLEPGQYTLFAVVFRPDDDDVVGEFRIGSALAVVVENEEVVVEIVLSGG